jgi:hypothetical protein
MEYIYFPNLEHEHNNVECIIMGMDQTRYQWANSRYLRIMGGKPRWRVRNEIISRYYGR